MGADTPHGPDAGYFSLQGGPTANSKETATAPGRKLGIPPFIGSDLVGRAGRSGGVHTEEA